jgi:hypothetical protein
MDLTPTTWRWFAAIAALGTLTTAYNTGALLFIDPAPQGIEAQAVLRDDALRMSREWALLVHALATLIAPLGLTLWLLRDRAALAITAFVFTFIEKLTELYGQTIRVFAVNGVWRRQILETDDPELRAHAIASIRLFGEIWNDLFFVLWLCGALAALLYGVALLRRSRSERFLSLAAMLVALLTVPMIATDCFGYAGPSPHSPGLYVVLMTAYRLLIVLVLLHAARSAAASIRPHTA